VSAALWRRLIAAALFPACLAWLIGCGQDQGGAAPPKGRAPGGSAAPGSQAPARAAAPGGQAPGGAEPRTGGGAKDQAPALELLWSREITRGKVRRAWASGDCALVVTEEPPSLHLLRLQDGYVHWSCEFEHPAETAYPPTLSGDAVMVVIRNRILRMDRAFGTMVCIIDPEVPIGARPILETWIDVDPAIIYVPGANGQLWALQVRKTVRELASPIAGAPPIKIERYGVSKAWSTEVPTAGGQTVAPPAMLDGVIYVCASDGCVLGLGKDDGRPVFRIPNQGQVPQGLALSGNRAYFGRSDGQVCCIDRRSGDRIWELPAGGAVSERPRPDPDGGAVYAFGEKQGAFAVDDKTGRELWRNRDIRQLLGVGRKAVYAAGAGGRIVALDKSTGAVTGTFATEGLTVVPDGEPSAPGGGPLMLMGMTARNAVVCLAEPGARPPPAAPGTK
jgi:hypothetical protein